MMMKTPTQPHAETGKEVNNFLALALQGGVVCNKQMVRAVRTLSRVPKFNFSKYAIFHAASNANFS